MAPATAWTGVKQSFKIDGDLQELLGAAVGIVFTFNRSMLPHLPTTAI